MLAAGAGHARAVEELLALGAEKNARTAGGGATALVLAAEHGHVNCDSRHRQCRMQGRRE